MPYQRKKLVLLFSAMRHYASSLTEQGFTVDYRQSADSLSGLRAHLHQFNPSKLICMAVNNWFSALYVDAYEWVMLPNVLGMGLNADGGKIATKPYIASANYIRRMNDYCSGCSFNPLKRIGADACPFNFLYWNFLLSHASALSANPRISPGVRGIKRIGEPERAEIQAAAARFLESFER